MERGAVAHAREGLLVLGTGFAAIGVADAGLRHQVAFVTGIDEHFGGERIAVFERDSGHLGAALAHAALLFQAASLKEMDTRLSQHLAKGILRHVWLVDPANVLSV